MENKNNIEEELESIAPFLSKIKKENNFSTPLNYFEILPEVIVNRSLNSKLFNFSFNKFSKHFLIPASSLAVILLMIFYFNRNTTEAELTNEQITNLIINDEYIKIDDYLVYDAYSEVLDEEKKTTSTTDEYINYLIENDIDINSIIDEL
ncbi:MAG: hypothetical protein A3K10_17385 [Bacteroidetes bacterium RIFCSPLOWO2_12_FULL_31_6]|nr:MAG: hypothetical protein A3K10_17385 [Bacteroidetes bacterium RIFCSPLOWO2_12_FULL_31_6]